ncbi:MAG: PLP-dependent aminotransferase family protein [Kordiimonadaceae bacterium]|nr:PLP-dependent aminotransferase family protein [Kordiimonadaceae bacterium]
MFKPYTRIADRIAERIAKGELPIGTRLPPQRVFAYEEGIAPSTASRVYEELCHRGLVAGEVGRGTFVTNRFAPLDPSLQEPSGAGLDLEIVFRLGTDAREKIATSTARFFKKGLAEHAAAPPSVRGNAEALKVLAGMMTTDDFHVDPDSLLLAGSGKEAIAASISALAPRGGRIAVEALTYPFVIAAARLLGIELVPLPLDSEGIDPDALDRQASLGLDGVYLQPTLQSPLVLTMTLARRKMIAEILIRHNLVAIEDRVYGFLRTTRPIAAFAPDHVIQIDSLSKRLMPGLAVGLIIAPLRLHNSLARSLRAGGWMAPTLSVALAWHWIEEGIVSSVELEKRREAAMMFDIARRSLFEVDFHGAPDALHGWIALPPKWRGESFAAASAKLGIAVAPGRAFAVTQGTAPSGVRIAYSAPDLRTWKLAIKELGKLARQSPAK